MCEDVKRFESEYFGLLAKKRYHKVAKKEED